MKNGMIAALLLSGAVVVGCEQSGSDGTNATPKSNDMMENLRNASKDAGNAGASALESAKGSVGDLGDKAGAAMDAVVKPIQTQLSDYASKLESLKSQAGALTNTDLNTLVDNAMAKYNEIKAKVDAALGGDNAAMEALKADGSAMLTELKGYYDQAMTKLAELKPSGA